MYDDSQPPQASGPDTLTIRPLHGRTGLILAGEADWSTQDKLHAALTTLPAGGPGDIHLDLTELRFIDLSCTREFIAITQRQPAARLIVYRPPASLKRILAILHPEARIEFMGTSKPVAEKQPEPGLGQPGGCRPLAGRRPPVPDIVELILAEHVRISELIESLDSVLADAGPASRGAGPCPAWAALARFLRFHVEAAGEIAYPALASDEHGVALAIKKASEADADIREVLEEARLSRPGSRAWHMAVQAACSEAKNHITCVESGPLRRLQFHAAPSARRALGRQWVVFMTAQVLDASARLPRHRFLLRPCPAGGEGRVRARPEG